MNNEKCREDYLLEANRKFFDKISKWYDFFFGNLTLKMHRKVIKNFSIEENAIILDAGCGTGNLLSILENSEKSLTLYGIDISEKMLDVACKKLRKSNLVEIAVEDMQFKNFFDYAFSIDCFHHYADPKQAMKSLYIALKNNSYLVVVDLNFGSFLNKLFQKIEPGNNMFYSPSEIKMLFQKYKFQDVQQKKIGFFSIITYGRKYNTISELLS